MPLLGSSIPLYAACQDQVCSLEGKTNLSTQFLLLIAVVLSGRVRRAAPRPRLSRSPSGRSCSPRRRASATTRSPPAWRRSERLGRAPRLLGGYDRATPAGSPPRALDALRRRDLPLHDRHPDQARANSSARSSATSADGGGYVGVHAASDTRGDWPWYERLVGARFKRHDPGIVRADACRSPTAAPPPRAASRTRGRAPTSGTSSAPTRRRVHVLAAPRRDASARVVPPLRWRPLGVHRDGSYEGVLRRASLLGHLLGAIEMAAGRARFDCAP